MDNNDTSSTSNQAEIDAANEAARVDGPPLEVQAPPSDTDAVKMVASNFNYSQTEMRAKAGTTLVVDLSVSEGTHDFVIDELEINSEVLSAGDTKQLLIQIPEDASGKTFEYYCSVMNHREMGMLGKLIIE